MPTYICKDIPFKQVRLVETNGADGKDAVVHTVNFDNGVLELDDKLAKLMDELCQRKPAIARGIVKVDKKAAEEEVRKLRSKNQNTLGVLKGGVTGASGPTIANMPKDEVAVQAFTVSGDAEGASDLAKGATAKG